MKITAIHLYAIRLPLRDPFVISYGSYSDMPSIIVKMKQMKALSVTVRASLMITLQANHGKVLSIL